MGKNRISKVLLLSTFLFGFILVSQAQAADVQPMYVSLSVTMQTDENTYHTNEAVEWVVNASGGTMNYGDTPNYDVHFWDSEGNDYWYETNKFDSRVRLDYQSTGDVQGCATVYGVGDPDTDCKTVTIE